MFNLFFILIKNNNLNFNKFIINCKTISYISNFDKQKKKKNIKDNFYNNINKFVIKCIFKQFQEKELSFIIQIIVYKTELMVRKNVSKKCN